MPSPLLLLHRAAFRQCKHKKCIEIMLQCTWWGRGTKGGDFVTFRYVTFLAHKYKKYQRERGGEKSVRASEREGNMYSESNFWRLTAVGVAFWPQLSGAAIFEDLSIRFQIFEHTREVVGGSDSLFSELEAFNMSVCGTKECELQIYFKSRDQI